MRNRLLALEQRDVTVIDVDEDVSQGVHDSSPIVDNFGLTPGGIPNDPNNSIHSPPDARSAPRERLNRHALLLSRPEAPCA